MNRAESGTTDNRVLEQAAEWFALLRSGETTPTDEALWQHWLDEHEEHRAAWQYVVAVGQRFDALRHHGQIHSAESTLDQLQERRLSRRRLLGNTVVVLGGSALLAASWPHTPFPRTTAKWRADHRTAIGEIRDIRLADGSRVWLNTDSALNVDLSRDLRRLQLVAGEILVDTATDSRPLVVETERGLMRALGTRFTIRRGDRQTYLAVYDGAVAIRTREGRGITLQAGQATRFDEASIGEVEQADAARQAWSRGLLLARDITLQAVVAELRRYTRAHFGVAEEIADLRVVGGFPLTEPDRVLAMLEKALPVSVRRPMPWWVNIVPCSGGA